MAKLKKRKGKESFEATRAKIIIKNIRNKRRQKKEEENKYFYVYVGDGESMEQYFCSSAFYFHFYFQFFSSFAFQPQDVKVYDCIRVQKNMKRKSKFFFSSRLVPFNLCHTSSRKPKTHS